MARTASIGSGENEFGQPTHLEFFLAGVDCLGDAEEVLVHLPEVGAVVECDRQVAPVRGARGVVPFSPAEIDYAAFVEPSLQVVPLRIRHRAPTALSFFSSSFFSLSFFSGSGGNPFWDPGPASAGRLEPAVASQWNPG